MKLKNLKEGEEVNLQGFVHNFRNKGKIVFIELRKQAEIIQIVLEGELAEKAQGIVLEAVISVTGVTQLQSKGELELLANSFELLSLPVEKLPIPVRVNEGENETNLFNQQEYRWLELRKPKNQIMLKVWTEMERSFVEFMIKEGTTQIHSPKILGAPSESGAEVFEVKYFEETAYLAQSPQFYKQMAMAAGLEKVFEIGPVFRAEKSNTYRHATEFTSYDFEMSYVKELEELIEFEKGLLAYIFSSVKEKYGKEMFRIMGIELGEIQSKFIVLPFEEARELIGGTEEENDFNSEEEAKLGKVALEKYGAEFIFLTEYPVSRRPFYHMRESTTKTKSFDLIYRGLEITTCAIREHRYEVLIEQAKEKEMNLENIQFYLNFFKHGCPPHGGFCLGMERILLKLFGLENIRQVQFCIGDQRD
ncbi:MAG: aspartate--tRNA(Asn) ligase [Candidatus Dojkabacteria bacterium]|nr:aspartate--tRNA(Asn) ligase [Candidatus Dojkabacteria bacterium]MDQ7020558.1 aspartate--tRNA(Asn) ligase [Candidatus Dojkabacteria bacterium]